MKNIFSLIIVSFFVFSISAQEKKANRLYKKQNENTIYKILYLNSLKSGSDYQKLDSTINYISYTFGILNPYFKETFFYDEKGNMILDIDYVWNETKEIWENDFKWELTYDDSNYCILNKIFEWEEFESQWINYYKEEYSCDLNGNQTLISYFIPDTTPNQWINDYKEEYSYNIFGNMELHLYYNWDSISNNWIFDYKEEFEYNNYNNLAEKYYYDWDTIKGEWVNDYMEEYFYNNELLSQIHFFNWDTATGIWINDFLKDYNYDDSENVLKDVFHKWDTLSDSWINSFKEEFFYNDSSYLIQYFTFLWESDSGKWMNEIKKEYTFPSLVSQSNLILPLFFYELEGKTDVDVLASSLTNNWDKTTEDWLLDKKRELFFSDFNGIINPVTVNKFSDFKIYPNPASDFIFIDSSKDLKDLYIQLYNINGQLLYQNYANEKIRVTQFPKGIYFINIIDSNKKVSTQKINIK